MTISIEQIDSLRKRANVSYKEAKEALEKSNGDLVEALLYLEEQNKIKPQNESIKDLTFIKKIKNLISKANKIKFVISKNDKTILNIPSTIAVLLCIFAMPVAIAVVVVALITNCKIRFHKDSGEECSINSQMDKVSNAVSNVTNKMKEEIKNA
jgi:endo-alpha-1,4-polygalactosaminidase (GH114 family)